MSAEEEIIFSRSNPEDSMEETTPRPGLGRWVASQKAHLEMDIQIHSVYSQKGKESRQGGVWDCVEVLAKDIKESEL